ncbi:MAG: hypothetical protein WCM76_09095 [Bacteroidota bacterium]
MRTFSIRFGTVLMIVMLCCVFTGFAQNGIAPLIKEKGQHLIVGNDTVFTDWTDGYTEATACVKGGADAKEESRRLAESLLLDAVFRIMIYPDLSVGVMMNGSSYINQAVRDMVGKCKVVESKIQGKKYMTKLRLNLYKWEGDYPVLAAGIIQFTRSAGSAAVNNDTDGSGSGSDASDMNERSEKNAGPGVDAAGETPNVPVDAQAEGKRIITQTEKYFIPALFPDYYSMLGRSIGAFSDAYPSSETFIPHYYIIDEPLQLILESYNANDLLRARVNADKKYKLDKDNESKWYSWKSKTEKAVHFGKFLILYY